MLLGRDCADRITQRSDLLYSVHLMDRSTLVYQYIGSKGPPGFPATGVSTTRSAPVLLRILDSGPSFPGFLAFLAPKILDTKIVHTSGEIYDFSGSKFSIFWGVEKCRKIFLTYVPI